MNGAVLNTIKKIRESIIHEIAFIESALDDPEHVSLDGYSLNLYYKKKKKISEIQKLLDTSDNGKILKEGINMIKACIFDLDGTLTRTQESIARPINMTLKLYPFWINFS